MDDWLDGNGHERGAVLDLETLWELAKAWYDGRLSPAWRGRKVEDSTVILRRLGLDGEFWRLS